MENLTEGPTLSSGKMVFRFRGPATGIGTVNLSDVIYNTSLHTYTGPVKAAGEEHSIEVDGLLPDTVYYYYISITGEFDLTASVQTGILSFNSTLTKAPLAPTPDLAISEVQP